MRTRGERKRTREEIKTLKKENNNQGHVTCTEKEKQNHGRGKQTYT
jgi:hypothetical protein